jgi:hypothetical protein
MAVARPPTDAARGAEHGFYRMVDATCDDLRVLHRRWPSQLATEVLQARARLAHRDEPGGEAEQALLAVYRAYGGAARVPPAVRQRLEAYVEERLGRRPWPERDPAEDLGEPALVRKQRRQRREARG